MEAINITMEEVKIPDYVKSIIYLIRCTHPESSQKVYIGQTRTHVLNHGLYRPFGAMKRWDQHVSEAMNATSRQSVKLNNAIRKYGTHSFEVETLGLCDIEMADPFERAFIKTHDSVARGYNITTGGKRTNLNALSRDLISLSLMEHHDTKRLAKFGDICFESIKLGVYLKKGVKMEIRGFLNGFPVVRKTNFYGQRLTAAGALERALLFASHFLDADHIEMTDDLKTWQGDQIAGNP